jgi:hypothetical protein
MLYLLFLLELILLFVLSQTLSKSISRVVHTLTHSIKATIYVIAFLFFPGTLIHEIAHAVMAMLLRVPVGNMRLLPEVQEGGVKLGSVQIAKSDPIRRALIGVAPFLIGMTILLGIFYGFLKSVATLPIWAIILGVYGVFEIANTMFSSRKDLEGTVEIIGAIVVVSTILYLVGVRLPHEFLAYFQNAKTLSIITQCIYYLLIPVGIDVVSILVAKGIGSLFQRRY